MPTPELSQLTIEDLIDMVYEAGKYHDADDWEEQHDNYMAAKEEIVRRCEKK